MAAMPNTSGSSDVYISYEPYAVEDWERMTRYIPLRKHFHAHKWFSQLQHRPLHTHEEQCERLGIFLVEFDIRDLEASFVNLIKYQSLVNLARKGPWMSRRGSRMKSAMN